jgi:hypothetical protein
MAPILVENEPVGIVVRDGGDSPAVPRIMMWYWANEEETPERERD